MSNRFKQKVENVTVGAATTIVATIPITNMREFAVDCTTSGTVTITYVLSTAALEDQKLLVPFGTTSVATSAVTRNTLQNSHATVLFVNASATATVPFRIIVTSVGEGK